MGKHFISVLGTSFYSECNYLVGDGSYVTKFVQEASLELECGEMGPEDRITICLTKEAKKNNWQDRPFTSFEINNRHMDPNGTYTGLETHLKRYGDKVNAIDIPKGATSEELDQMFFDIYNLIGEGEEVYFDITHGLRNIPMLVMATIQYAKVTKNITMGGIFYGAFEVGEMDPETNIKNVKIFDLSTYSDIFNWSNAADSFIKYGNAKQMSALFDVVGNYSVHSREERLERDNKYKALRELMDSINTLTKCIETGRGRYRTKADKSIQSAYEKYKEQKGNITDELAGNYKPLGVLIEQMDAKLKMFDKSDNLQTGLATIRWSIDNEMVQQGYTALEETIKTFICDKAGVPNDNKKWREGFAKRLLSCMNKTHQNNKDCRDSQTKEIIRRDVYYQEWLEDQKEHNNAILAEEGIQEIAAKIIDTVPTSLVILSGAISDYRNDINHFGYSDKEMGCDKFMEKLRVYYADFQKIMDEWTD